VALFTGAEASALPSSEELGVPVVEKRAILDIQEIHQSNGSHPPKIWTGRNTFNVYFPGIFWQLAFVMIVFWTVVALGLKLLLELQAPDRIPTGAGAKKKK